jgi:hypothetical protein
MRIAKRNLKKQSQSPGLPGNPKHEIRNPKRGLLTEYDLKKQSQFVAGPMNVSVLQTKDYVNEPRFEGRGNKASQSQSQTCTGLHAILSAHDAMREASELAN